MSDLRAPIAGIVSDGRSYGDNSGRAQHLTSWLLRSLADGLEDDDRLCNPSRTEWGNVRDEAFDAGWSAGQAAVVALLRSEAGV